MADRGGYIGRNPGDSSVIISRQTFEPTGVQTDFTFASGYTPGYLDVYLNGSRLIVASDYTATDGSVVGLTTYALNGDVLELVAYKAFNLGSIDTATGNFTVGGDLTVNGTTTGISSVSYATTSFGLEGTPNIAVGDINSTGNVSIGGTLTYEDVTNIDSVGIITARSTIDAQGDVSIADKIIHTGDTNTAIRFPDADTFTVETAAIERIRVDSSGNLGVGIATPAASRRLHVADSTTAFSQWTTHNTGSSHVDGTLVGIQADNSFQIWNYENSYFRISTNNTERLRIESDGVTHISNNSGDSLHWNSYNCHLLHTDATDFTTLIENSHDSNPNVLGLHMSDAAPNNGTSTYLQCYDTSGGSTVVRAKITSDGTISDSKGNLRSIPQNSQGGTYTLVASDAGKHIEAVATITIPNNVFSEGDAVTIVNNSSSTITLTRSITTMYMSSDGTNAASRSLTARGMCTILFMGGTEAFISGAGLS